MAYTAGWTKDYPKCELTVDNVKVTSRGSGTVTISFSIKGRVNGYFRSPNHGGTAFVGNWEKVWIDPSKGYGQSGDVWNDVFSATGSTTISAANTATSATVSFGSTCPLTAWTSLNFSSSFTINFSQYNPTVDVTSVTVSPTTMSLVTNGTNTGTITPTVNPSNATNKTITWSTNNSNVATVSGGKVTAVGNGTCTITAKSNNGKAATCSVTVTTAVTSVTLSQTSLSLDANTRESKTITATVNPSNASTKSVSWSSSNTSVATVNNGTITAVGNGNCTITASCGGKSATCSVSVTTSISNIYLNTNSISLVKNGNNTYTLSHTIYPATASNTNVSWSTSNGNVATVSGGTVTAVGNGTCTITVTCGGKSDTCSVTVTTNVTGVTLNPTTMSLITNVSGSNSKAIGFTIFPSDASDTGVSWSSSNDNVAVYSNGYINAVGNGTCTITVRTNNGSKTATCSVTVTTQVTGVSLNVYQLNLATGRQYTLVATVEPSTASNKNVTWKTDSGSIATVNGDGVVTGVGVGITNISVTTADQGKMAICNTVIFEDKGPQGTLTTRTYHNDSYKWVNEKTKYGLIVGNTFIENVQVGDTDIYKLMVDNTKVWFKSDPRQSPIISDNVLNRPGSYTSNSSGGCATIDHCINIFRSNRANPISPTEINLTYNLNFYSSTTGTCTIKLFGYNEDENGWCEIPVSNNTFSVNGTSVSSPTGGLTINVNTNNFYTNFRVGIFPPNKFVTSCTTGNIAFTKYDVDKSLE